MLTIPALVTIVGGFVSFGAFVFGALKYNREEAGKIVTQQTNVLTDMRALNDELVEHIARLREERDSLREQRDDLRTKVDACSNEIRELRAVIEALEKKIVSLEATISHLEELLNKRAEADGG